MSYVWQVWCKIIIIHLIFKFSRLVASFPDHTRAVRPFSHPQMLLALSHTEDVDEENKQTSWESGIPQVLKTKLGGVAESSQKFW